MANFMDELVPGSRFTWRDYCDRETPRVGTNSFLTGPWGDAIVAAVACEKAGKACNFSDGPAGQVLDYLLQRGHKTFLRAAEVTEEAAHAGRLRLTGGPRGDPRPICQFGPSCYRKNPEHHNEFAHPWLEEKRQERGWACSRCTLQNREEASVCEACDTPRPGLQTSPATVQVRCGRCSFVYDVAAPPGTPAGSTLRAGCPKCQALNEAKLPGTAVSTPIPVAAPHAATSVGARPPRLTGRKRALLVGINYFGTRAELRGCINDVHNIYRLLTETYGWKSADIRILTDDGRGGGMPTRRNIESSLSWLAQNAAPGDVLFFSFSGHGAQREDPYGFEEDGMNETILPVDFQSAGMMTDDDLGNFIVKPLPAGVRLTSVMDCCHSGSGLDLPFTWDQRRGMWREDVNPFHTQGDVLMFSGCEDDDTSSDASTAYGAAGGAMSTAFCDVLRRNPNPTYPQLLDLLHRNLRGRGFSQRPVLSSSQQFSLDRPFSFDDIHPNMNPQLGRIFRRRFPPRPRNYDGPLGDMLGAMGLLAGGLILGQVAGGLFGGLLDIF